MSLTGLKDVDREILKHMDDRELILACSLNRKTRDEICDDGFFRRRLSKYRGIEKYKSIDENWKKFFIKIVHYVSLLKDEFNFEYIEGDFKNMYQILKNYKGLPSLMEAVKEGSISFVKYLINNKNADKNRVLSYASKFGNLEVVEWLIFNLSLDVKANNNEALIYAGEGGNLKVVKYLINLGADIHARNDTCLKRAVVKGHTDIVKYLVGKGCNIHMDNELLLRIASENGNTELVKWLIDNGCNVRANDDSLIWASRNGHLPIVQLLVENNCIVTIQALHWAKENKHHDVAEYLERYL